jgi:hypothetical protein
VLSRWIIARMHLITSQAKLHVLCLTLYRNLDRAEFRLYILHNNHWRHWIHSQLPRCYTLPKLLERVEIPSCTHIDVTCGFLCVDHRLDHYQAMEYCYWYSGQSLLFIRQCNLRKSSYHPAIYTDVVAPCKDCSSRHGICCIW